MFNVFYAITVVSSLQALNEIKEELIVRFSHLTQYHTHFPGFGETSYMTFKGGRKHVRIDFFLSLNLGMLPNYLPVYSNFKSLKE